MNTDRETTRAVRSWLGEGVTRLPDTILDAVLDELPSIRQRRASWWPPRRPGMSPAVQVGVAAAVVVIAAIVGIRLLGLDGSGLGGPGEQPTPTPSASPMAWPQDVGVVGGGTYLSDSPAPVRTTITVPKGWSACGVHEDALVVCSAAQHLGAVSVSIVDNVVADPCDRDRELLEPPVGSSVDDLVSAISSLSGFTATPPVDISLDGYPGKQFEVTAPTQPACVLDDAGLGTWTFPPGVLGVNGVGAGELNVLRIVDVDGVRVMIAAAIQPTASASEAAELREVFESVRIRP